MNTNVLIAAQGLDVTAGLRAARESVEDGERRFSRFLPESELSQLNRAAGEWFDASPEMMEVLQTARTFFNGTNGLFDPSILPDLKRAGYDRSMDEIRVQGTGMAIIAPARTPKAAFGEIELDLISSRVRLPKTMQLDLGGIAKGWIVDRAAGLLGQYSDSCAVNAGGDMRFIGRSPVGMGWEVDLEDPRDPAKTIARLSVSSGAVATSSVTKRTWKQGRQARHHLIDPRSGEPAESDWLCVTAIADDAVAAEVHAKTLLIGGPAEAQRLSRNGIVFLTVDRKGKLSGSQNIQEYLNEHDFVHR